MATANEVIKIADNEVGYLEKKSNSNLDDKTANAGYKNYTKYARDFDTKYVGFYNGKKNGFAWCDIFVDWCFVKAFGVDKALQLLGQPKKSCGAGCGFSANYFKKINCFYTSPKIGDQIFFKDSDGDVCHTGLVYKVTDKTVYTIEGNTSSAKGVVANGGAVAKKSYSRTSKSIYGYGRPKYDAEPEVVKTESNKSKVNSTIQNWQQAAIKDGYKFPKYGADGSWGSECESVAKKALCKKGLKYTNKNLTKIVQKKVGVTADGLFGNATKNAVITYQKKNGLVADGVVGLNTWKKILGVK